MALLSQYAAMDNRNYNDKIRREQNIFNKYEAQRAREWNQQMDSTKYQRAVTDMQSAGVNPALAMNGGVTTQATSNAQAQGANVGTPELDLSQVAQMVMQQKQLNIQERQVAADVRLKNAEANAKEIENGYAEEYNQLRNRGVDLANQLSVEQIGLIRKNVDEIDSRIDKLKQETKTEQERTLLTRAEKELKESMKHKTDEEIRQMVELLPFTKALSEAQTEQAKSMAALNFVKAASERKLLSEGYYDAMISELRSEAKSAEARAEIEAFEKAYKSGDLNQ